MGKVQLSSKVYVVNGAPGAGKDTFCSYVKEIMPFHYCQVISTVDFVKQIAYLCWWNGEKTPKDRKFLSDLKDLLTAWGEVPIKKCLIQIEEFETFFKSYELDPSDGVTFLMAREPSDIYVLSHIIPNCKTLIVRNSNAEAQTTSNHADAEVLNYNYDIEIDNNGDLENLKKEANSFIIKEKLLRRTVK